MKNLLIAGNSHVGRLYFDNKYLFERMGYNQIYIAISNVYSDGFDPGKDTFLTSFRLNRHSQLYLDMLDAGTDLSKCFIDFSVDPDLSTDVLLVGMQFHGESVHELFGWWGSAVLPYTHDFKRYFSMDSEHSLLSGACIREVYDKHYERLSLVLDGINRVNNLTLLAWLSSPRPAESSAIWAYGKKVVDSGLLGWHYSIDLQSVDEKMRCHELGCKLIIPNESIASLSGLTPDSFLIAESDNHVHGSFYEKSLKRIF